MNKEELIRTLAAHAADAVVLLEKIWPDNDAFPPMYIHAGKS